MYSNSLQTHTCLQDPPEHIQSLFCVGYNHSYSLRQDDYIQVTLDGNFTPLLFAGISPKQDKGADLRPYRPEGGAVCFGDSGAPLWVYSEDANGTKIPVQLGVFR